MQIFFFLQIPLIIFSIKTEIKFNLNVPSLFRCKRNGRVFYFETFPTNELFNKTITNQNKECDLSLSTLNKRIIFNVDTLYLRCKRKTLTHSEFVTEILVFKSNCTSNDLCTRITPTTAIIVRRPKQKSHAPVLTELSIDGISTSEILIGEKAQYSYLNSDYSKTGYRRYQILFKMNDNTRLNMMCEYTYVNFPQQEHTICPRKRKTFSTKAVQMRNGSVIETGDGWSWICYYYPPGAEDPIDHLMIDKAIAAAERVGGSNSLALSDYQLSNLTEFSDFDHSSTLSNKTNIGSLTFIFVSLFVIVLTGGICCIYIKKHQTKSARTPSSVPSEDSITINRSLSDESV